MSVSACGINHKTAPLGLREKLVFAADTLSEPLLGLVAEDNVKEAVILSTCNRTELYCKHDDEEFLLDWWLQHFQLKQQELEPYMYFHHDRSAVKHMMRVASGLDSLVLGEPQILGQMKIAYSRANQTGVVGPHLGRLFQHVFATTKLIRTQTAIGNHSLSIAALAVNLSKRIFADLSQATVLFVGAGETISLAAKYFYDHNVKRMIIANRTVARAAVLADQFNGESITISDLPDYLADVDIVITATASPLPILGKGLMERTLKLRKRKPIFMVDLAVPRDIEQEVADLEDIYLYCVDDLQGEIQQGLAQRQTAAEYAEEIIELQTEEYMRWLRSLGAVQTVRDYRGQAGAVQEQLVNRALSQLEHGTPAEEVIRYLAHRLTNKLIHIPTVNLREASARGDKKMLEYARRLFNLDDEE